MIIINGAMRTRGRPKRTRIELTKKDMLMFHVTEEMVFNKAEWKKIIHVANPIKIGNY